MKKLLAVSMLSMLLISGCKPPEKVNLYQENFTIVGLNPPKHFYVDLKDSKGKIHKRVYVSKHCNNWRKIKIGSEITLSVTTYKNDDGLYDRIEASSVCPR